MEPNYERAANAAALTLINHNIVASPIAPLPILMSMPNVLVMSFGEIGSLLRMDRNDIVPMFGQHNQDAVTFVELVDGKPHYMVAYNQQLPFSLVQRALAREMSHIVLGHDGSLPEDVRNEESRCFAHHLLAPRALIHSVQATGIRLTVEVLGNLTGCYDRCLHSMRQLPPVHADPELNRSLRDRFMPYVTNFFEFQRVLSLEDGSALADFGKYMEGYEE